MEKTLRHIILLLLLPLALGAAAQKPQYERYVAKYAPLAVEQMKSHGVPASITLAQGLLESAAGTSRLATQGNNHFGIKCGCTWKGRYMLLTDDAPNEKFRVYGSVRESYEDHSAFLRNGRRYAFLFDLPRTDYKAWAHGLKRAGYATNPRYAYLLINLIEAYGLNRYDGKDGESRRERKERKEQARLQEQMSAFEVRRCNGQYYIVARAGDTYASLARQTGIREKKLRAYNDATDGMQPQAGSPVYLGKKARKAMKVKGASGYHVMEAGESLYTISQRYGVRLASLCKMNPLPSPDYHFKPGDSVRLR